MYIFELKKCLGKKLRRLSLQNDIRTLLQSVVQILTKFLLIKKSLDKSKKIIIELVSL